MEGVTEELWLTATDFSTLHHILWHVAQEYAWKYRLIGSSFCRLFCSQTLDERGNAVLDLAERYCDDPELGKDLDDAFREAEAQGVFGRRFYIAYLSCIPDDHWNFCSNELDRVMGDAHDLLVDEYEAPLVDDAEWEVRSEAVGRYTSGIMVPLMREVFGNPFRPVTVNPAWLTSDVRLLAMGIYDEKAFNHLPILADALQDAGCDSDDILNHFRDPNATHVRGCWALDLVLGKE